MSKSCYTFINLSFIAFDEREREPLQYTCAVTTILILNNGSVFVYFLHYYINAADGRDLFVDLRTTAEYRIRSILLYCHCLWQTTDTYTIRCARAVTCST